MAHGDRGRRRGAQDRRPRDRDSRRAASCWRRFSRSCRCSCWRITSPCGAAAMWISRATWPRASRSNSERVNQAHASCRSPRAAKDCTRSRARSPRWVRGAGHRDRPADGLHPAHLGVADDSGERRPRRGARPGRVLRAAGARRRRPGTGTPSRARTTCPRTSARRSRRRSSRFRVEDGRLALGTWQGIYVFEHRSVPHRRSIVLHVRRVRGPWG